MSIDTDTAPSTPAASRRSVDTPAFAALFALVIGYAAFAVIEGTTEQGILLFAGFWAVWAAGAVLLGLRSTGKRDDGAASAWLAFGLPAPLFLAALAIPLIHPHYLLGQSICDPGTLFCDADAAPPGNWAPLVFFAIAVAGVFRALRRSRANARIA